MKILSIAFKDLLIFSKEPGALIQVFLLPFVFIIIFTLALGGPIEDKAILLPAVNLDPDGEKSTELIAAISSNSGIELQIYDQAEAKVLLEEGEIQHLLTIPANFSSEVNNGIQTELSLTMGVDANDQDTQAILLVIEGATRGLTLKHNLIASLMQIGEMQSGAPEEYQAFTAERGIAQAESQLASSRTRLLIRIEQNWPKKLGNRSTFNPVQVSVPGFTILFVFLAAQTTAASIYTEKKVGSFRRLLAAPMTKVEMLIGKLLPNFIMVIVQMAVIFAISVFVLPVVGLDRFSLGNDPLALIILTILIALCSTSLGILIAALARTENQIGGFSAAILWVMGGVGGSFFPSFFLSGFLASIGKVVPHYWANKAFNDLLVRGADLAGLMQPMLILLGFSVLFFAIGLWRFDFD